MTRRHIDYFDFLRVIAVFAVIVIHITSIGIYYYDIESSVWKASTLVNCISHWAVPIFFMISGALFLSPQRELSLKKLYSKNIKRIVICIVVWGFFYSLLDQYIYASLSLKSVLIAVYGIFTDNTGYHLWFLYTLVMLYIAVPLFRIITGNASKRMLQYALIMWVLFSLLVGQINGFAKDFEFSEELLPYSPYVIASYGGYFLGGYYFTEYPLKGKAKSICYALSVASIVAIIAIKIIFRNLLSITTFTPEMSMGILSCLIAVGVFTLAQNIRLSDLWKKIFGFIGKYTFGIYLTHVFFISVVFHMFNLKFDYCQPLLAIIISSTAMFVISLLTSWLMSKIPLLRKLV